eukprot:980351-Amphidinium_carterae.1
MQAHGAEVPNVPQAYGLDDKGKGKEKGKDKNKPRGGGRGGTPKGAGGKPPTTYRNRDDKPNDKRPICPEFLKDRGCNKG